MINKKNESCTRDHSLIIPFRYYVVWVREVNEAPNFFEAFAGKNCAKSRSMKQPFWFILDKKSAIRWMTTKSFAAVHKPKNALIQHSEDRDLLALCVLHHLQYTHLSSWWFCFILDRKSTIRWSDNKIICSYTQTKECLDFINTQRTEVCMSFVSCIIYSIHTAVFSMISFDKNNEK